MEFVLIHTMLICVNSYFQHTYTFYKISGSAFAIVSKDLTHATTAIDVPGISPIFGLFQGGNMFTAPPRSYNLCARGDTSWQMKN